MYDAFGCGQSKKPRLYGAYNPEELLKDALAVLQSILQVCFSLASSHRMAFTASPPAT